VTVCVTVGPCRDAESVTLARPIRARSLDSAAFAPRGRSA
jgi:hypothetical protein